MRIATYGRPGAGKSTFTGMLADQFVGRGVPVVRIKLGAPLYDLQSIVYQVAGRPLVTPDRQDGLLLNDLGSHLRRINPAALTDTFTRRVEEAVAENPDTVVLCDDARAADIEALDALDFKFVQVWAPDDIRRLRKAGRADLSPGDENHPTEAEITITPSFRVENAGSMQALLVRAEELANGWTS
ncbi:ATP-binding protein [Kitasatospora aureofaciens]|uniref:ATP-binding protein n=1 Tax=Kitasatospora aureofaciens TaxID=1894 RepID=UPI001C459F45|nr:ATP-binding protein [Kitasatospora aureofaciens]MBV6701382.1 ATP-binding protein [Kitasatospora aureofaciens]